MFIVSKAAPTLDQLEDRMNRGMDKIEIQLRKDFFECSDVSDYNCIFSPQWDILHIHMPFIPRESDLPIEFIGNQTFKPIFLNVCKLAQQCAEYYNHRVNIVAHTNIPLETMKYLDSSLIDMENVFNEALANYPNIDFSIENGALYSTRKNDIRINPSSLSNNVDWANYLNSKFNTNRFNTTLDICHMLMTIKCLDTITQSPETAYLEKTIGWYFKQNAPLLKNIHLNNMHSYGLGDDHSETFNYSFCRDVELLNTVMELYKQHNLSCNITLEVEEVKYNAAVKAESLKELLLEKYRNIIS